MNQDDLQRLLDKEYPGQFIVESVSRTDMTRVRRRGQGQDDFEPEDVVGTYDLKDKENLTYEMIMEDATVFFQERGPR